LQSRLDRILAAGSADISTFGGTYAGGYCLMQNPEEFAGLIEFLIGHGPFANYLEIGIGTGGGIRVLNETVFPRTNTVIDTFANPFTSQWPEHEPHIRNVKVVRGDSTNPDTVLYVSLLGREFDLIGIDGEHSYPFVRADFHNYTKMAKPGALVWFHDTVSTPEGPGLYVKNLEREGFRVAYRNESGKLGIAVVEYDPRLEKP